MKNLALVLLSAFAVSCVGSPPVPCTDCSGKCVDTLTDEANCGACGKACMDGFVCTAGACKLSCASNLDACSGKCVDPQNDPANCGACGTTCPGTQACQAGQCQDVCSAGLTACTTMGGGNPHCANLKSDNLDCGSCGNACPGGHSCVAGTCDVTCASSLTLCGGADAGVCTALLDDNANCGACGKACSATQWCVRGACVDATPSSCEEYKDLFPSATDSDVTLYFKGNPLQPYVATCRNMGTSNPLTYVSVAGIDGGSTFSRYDNTSWGIPCVTQPTPDVRTTWSKVRLNPINGTVAISDYTFSTSAGSNTNFNITRVDFGTAADCACGRLPGCGMGVGVRYGTAQIDLRGTPFAIDTSTSWLFLGAGPGGAVSVITPGQLMTLSAGGCCGNSDPSQPVFGRTVQFRYFGLGCNAIHAQRPSAGTGVYSLVDGSGPGATEGPLVYCDMVGGGGGWSLVAKVDGALPDSKFAYDSPLWTNTELLGPVVPDETRVEAKYPAFGATPFTQVRVIATDSGGTVRPISMNFPQQDSLLATLSKGTATPTTMMNGQAAWTALVDGGTLQANCNAEGLDEHEPLGQGARVRIGLVANNEPDCNSPDSYAGVGASVQPLGAVAPCAQLPDGGPISVTTAGVWAGGTCNAGTAKGSIFATVWVR